MDSTPHNYMPYAQKSPAESHFAALQHQVIDKHIGDVGKDVISTVSSGDAAITSCLHKVSDQLCDTTASTRDAIDRASVASANNASLYALASADRDRDIQATAERTSAAALQAIEKNAGESRQSSVILDAANRQATSDLSRDIIMQGDKNGSVILTAIERNGSSNAAAISAASYQAQTLTNSTSAMHQASLCNMHEKLASQASGQYSSILLEQQKAKECLAAQLSDAKFEALRNKESLAAQLATSSCESKFEAMKSTQQLSSQMAECCCDIKTKVNDVSGKMDDTLRTLDNQRVRDALTVANSEVNLYKALDHDRGGYGRGRGYYRDHSPCRGGGGRGGGGNGRSRSP
jgi:hypothetical protein